jgi:hypothetical protein
MKVDRNVLKSMYFNVKLMSKLRARKVKNAWLVVAFILLTNILH